MGKHILLLISLFIFGCGNNQVNQSEVNESVAYREKIAKKFNLPNKPGKESYEKVIGVDVNRNGVRDEVEREIYFYTILSEENKYYPDIIELKLDIARKLESIINNENIIESHNDLANSIKNFNSYITKVNKISESERIIIPERSKITKGKRGAEANRIRLLVFNTKKRVKILKEKVRRLGVLSGKF